MPMIRMIRYSFTINSLFAKASFQRHLAVADVESQFQIRVPDIWLLLDISHCISPSYLRLSAYDTNPTGRGVVYRCPQSTHNQL